MKLVWFDFNGIYARLRPEEKDARWRPFFEEEAWEEQVADCGMLDGTNCYCNEASRGKLENIMVSAGAPHGVRFLGSGNYHYLSLLSTNLVKIPYTLVLFDHHPDMQKPAFEGVLSCGGWVRDALIGQGNLKKVVLIGTDRALFEEETAAFREEGLEKIIDNDRLEYIDERAGHPESDWERILPEGLPVFLSIDKDVLSEEEVKTNWDQGRMSLSALCERITAIASRRPLIGADICGEPDPREEGRMFSVPGGGACERAVTAGEQSMAVNLELALFLRKFLS